MVVSPTPDAPQIAPAHVWARVTAEQQHQIVRLLAQLAVHVIEAEVPSPSGLGHRKEVADGCSSSSVQNSARSS
jgi:isopropylmalate/homocitrate/citramalate synthase